MTTMSDWEFSQSSHSSYRLEETSEWLSLLHKQGKIKFGIAVENTADHRVAAVPHKRQDCSLGIIVIQVWLEKQDKNRLEWVFCQPHIKREPIITAFQLCCSDILWILTAVSAPAGEAHSYWYLVWEGTECNVMPLLQCQRDLCKYHHPYSYRLTSIHAAPEAGNGHPSAE